MKELLLQYAQYNVWANGLMINAMLRLDEKRLDKEVISSFLSVRKTVGHVWSAESIWLQRMQQVDPPVWQEGSFKGSFEEMCREWQKTSLALAVFISQQDDAGLNEILAYRDRMGRGQQMPIYHVLQHVFNHSTYHRGQLVTMMRQLGAMEIPATDFIWFVKKDH